MCLGAGDTAITMHPFETVFLKASWHVGEPFTSHYTKWFMQHALGQVRFTAAAPLPLPLPARCARILRLYI